MVIFTLGCASLGFLQQEHRAWLVNIMVVSFVLMGFFGGYFSIRFYKMFQGKEWLKTSLLTAIMFPISFFILIIITNTLYALEKSSATV
jgi:transmembrane 9 superfamily protein 2/4